MSAAGIIIPITLTADASQVTDALSSVSDSSDSTADNVDAAGAEMDTSMGDVGSVSQQTAATVGGSGGEISDDMESAGESWSAAGEGMARGMRSVVSGVGGLLSAEQNIYTAQQRVNVANINYILTVREYGAGSIQAARALDSLQEAQEGVSVAQEQLTLKFVQFGLQVGPQVYSMLLKVAAAAQGVTVANYEENASWAEQAALVGITVGILTAGLAVFGGLMASAGVSKAITSAQAGGATGAGLSPSPVATAGAAAGVPSAQEGGLITSPGLVNVGEAGPEYIVPARQMGSMSSNSSSYHITQHNTYNSGGGATPSQVMSMSNKKLTDSMRSMSR